jgi:hypothetical protein
MQTFLVPVAISLIHEGRRLLVSPSGQGYVQLALDSAPIPVPPEMFARLQRMGHYQELKGSDRRRAHPRARPSSRRRSVETIDVVAD